MHLRTSCILAVVVAIALTCVSDAAAVVGSRGPLPTDIPFICQTLADDARCALEAKDYDKAISLLEKAIELNPGDVGAGFDPLSYAVQKEESLWHGRTQLVRMLKDRPLMKLYLKSADELWSWTCSKYGDKIQGSRIQWDPSSVSTDSDAQHTIPRNGQPGRIRVRNLAIDPNPEGADASSEKSNAFEALWRGAVFELYNIQQAKEFEGAYSKVINGEMDQKTFVRTMFLIEMKSVQLTRKWYVEVFLRHAKKYNLTTNPDNWYCALWGTPKTILKNYSDKKSYPWEPYASHYSKLRARSRVSGPADATQAKQSASGREIAPR